MTATGEPVSASVKFSEALKTITWDDHEKAEYTEYMQAMLGGKLDISGYRDMVAQHYFAYVVLEEAAETMREDPIGGRFVFDSLLRKAALEKDLEHLLGEDWRARITPNAATTEYCARMRQVCFDWPGGYVAHSYTRYLGDLSGGQMIRASLERSFPEQLAGKAGVAFYLFPDIGDFAAFKVEYRQLLDVVDWSDEEQRKVIDEALVAYRLNTKVLAELGRDLARYLLARN